MTEVSNSQDLKGHNQNQKRERKPRVTKPENSMKFQLQSKCQVDKEVSFPLSKALDTLVFDSLMIGPILVEYVKGTQDQVDNVNCLINVYKLLTDDFHPTGRLLRTFPKVSSFADSLVIKMNKLLARRFYLNHLLGIINSPSNLATLKIELTTYFSLLYEVVSDDSALKDELSLELFATVTETLKLGDSSNKIKESLTVLLRMGKYANTVTALNTYFIKLEPTLVSIFRKASKLYRIILSLIMSNLRAQNQDFYARSKGVLFHTLDNQLRSSNNYTDFQYALELIRINQFGEGLNGYKVPQYNKKQGGPFNGYLNEIRDLMLLSAYKQIVNAPD